MLQFGWFMILIPFVLSSFTVIPLGTKGGFNGADLSSYALSSSSHPSEFIALDAGTLIAGIKVTQSKGHLSAYVPSQPPQAEPGYFLQNRIKAYLLSHAHLDHIEGLIINSVDDIAVKAIIGTNITLTYLQDYLFNNDIWPNFGPGGIGTYNFYALTPLVPFKIPGTTSLKATGFILRHHYPYLSTAFLVADELGYFVLYFGDCGPDSVENPLSSPLYLDTNRIVWEYVAPLVLNHSLMAVFIESSYADPREPSQLFGHLSPSYLSQELSVFEEIVQNLQKNTNTSKPLAGLNVVVTHIKPVASGEKVVKTIKKQLQDLNTFNVNYIFPEQGVPLVFQSCEE